jgi:type I restriction enzyme R subunit
MEFTAVKHRRNQALANPTIVVVTDRTDLDQQIHGTFLHCGFPNPVNAASAADLKEALSRPVGQTVMTTIQKFQDAAEVYPTLTEERNIFVLVDEAHRSQYNHPRCQHAQGPPERLLHRVHRHPHLPEEA